MNFVKSILICFLLAFSFSCSHNPYAVTNRTYRKEVKEFAKQLRMEPANPDSVPPGPYFVGTTNFNLRKPNFVIIHHTAQNSCEQTLNTFTNIKTQVSAHYVICKDGTVHHLLNDYLRAWHGGVAKWSNLTDVNSASVGIELDNNGFEPFPDLQVNSLLLLLAQLKKAYNIPTANFIGHADIAPGRKVDPNARFPWKLLADKGFGNWYDDTSLVIVPGGFDHLLALRIIGYDLKDSSAVIRSFKLHFEQDTVSTSITPSDEKILYNLSKKYR
jgi:N-acetylmuramoyl-L-alanine amidase